MKNRVSQEDYVLPGDPEAQIEAFVEHYNHQRYHESLSNVTPAEAYFDRASTIIKQREKILCLAASRVWLSHCDNRT